MGKKWFLKGRDAGKNMGLRSTFVAVYFFLNFYFRFSSSLFGKREYGVICFFFFFFTGVVATRFSSDVNFRISAFYVST